MHAYDSCEKRGVSEEEVKLAIKKGAWEPAKHDRMISRVNLDYNKIWEGKMYSVKQVAPVFVDEEDEIVVVTVYCYYF